MTTITTSGWTPSCNCPPAPPVPAAVLDPFSGTATTGAVALAHGRHYIGIELNAEYANDSLDRLREVAQARPLFAEVLE